MKKEFTISVRDILRNKLVKWENVRDAIKYHYPSDKSNYKKLFKELGEKRKKQTAKGEWLVVESGIDISDDWFKKDGINSFYFESLKGGDEEEYYSVNIMKEGEKYTYSCSFVPWIDMVNFPIHPLTFRHITMTDIVAHLIWEITFYGPEDKMKKQGKELEKISKDIEKKLDKGEDIGLPLDSVIKKVRINKK